MPPPPKKKKKRNNLFSKFIVIMIQILLKNSFGKVGFPILAKIKTTRNKTWYFGRHFETGTFFLDYGCLRVYDVAFIRNIQWESGFLGRGTYLYVTVIHWWEYIHLSVKSGVLISNLFSFYLKLQNISMKIANVNQKRPKTYHYASIMINFTHTIQNSQKAYTAHCWYIW